MPCFHPLVGYRGRKTGRSGKRPVVFNPREGFRDLEVRIPCGQCIGCRLERSRQWAIRCMHEASLYDANAFVTLTYDDAHLPAGGSLVPRDFQLFMKRLRRRIGTPVRFYAAGEYGGRTGRPHYHTLLFNCDFSDKVSWTVRNDHPVWRSALLESLWPLGQSEIGSVTFESAAYVARYIMKKQLGGGDVEWFAEGREGRSACAVELGSGVVEQVEPQYATMSRRPGIGRPWLEKYGAEVYPEDSVIVNGREVKPPRFYDGYLEKNAPEVAAAVFSARRRARDPSEETEERLGVREMVTKARLSLRERSLE